jgi:hypothetical protein
MTDQEFDVLSMMMLLFANSEIDDIDLLKDALDYAIEHNAPFDLIYEIRMAYEHFTSY